MNFKINIGNWKGYQADASLETPDSGRQRIGWVATSNSGLIATVSNIYNVGDKTPLLPNNWYFEQYYCAAAGSHPDSTPVDGVCSATWIYAAGGAYVTALAVDTACYNGYRFDIDTSTTGGDEFAVKHSFAGSDWFDNANNATGWTAIIRTKVIDSGSSRGQMFYVDDGTYREGIEFYTNKIDLLNQGSTHTMDTTDAYHVFKVVCIGTNWKVYIDDSTTATLDVSTNTASSAKQITFGDSSGGANFGGQQYWDFVTYYTGAEPTLMGTDEVYELPQVVNGQFPYLSGTTLILNTGTGNTDKMYFLQDNAGTKWVDSMNPATGYTVLVNCKVISGDANVHRWSFEDGTRWWGVYVRAGQINVPDAFIAEATQTYVMDTTDDYHEYKMVVNGTSLIVSVDGTERITGTLDRADSDHSLKYGNDVGAAGWGGIIHYNSFDFWDAETYSTTNHDFAVIASTSTKTPSGYSLDIDTPLDTADNGYYSHNAGTSPFFVNVSNERGYTIEFQKKVVDAGSTEGQVVYWDDDKWNEYVYFTAGAVGLGRDTTTYAMTTTDDFHKYRVTVKDTDCKVYVDDVLRITGTLATASVRGNMALSWGDYFGTANYGGESRWGYVKYTTEGAFAPEGAVNDGWVYERFDVSNKRRMSVSNVIRSDNSIIPENKMQPAKIKVSGTVVGSDWGSLRNSVRRLKRLLNSGTHQIQIDDERYIEGLNSNFTFKPVTQDYAKYSADFECRRPFWKELWASYVSTAPAHMSTFYVMNESDVAVPVRFVVTGATSGTLINFTIENTTNSKKLKYIGEVASTQELYIDSGYFNYNDYAVTIGTADTFASYEGDMITLDAGENAFVIGTGVGGKLAATVEMYWTEEYQI